MAGAGAGRRRAMAGARVMALQALEIHSKWEVQKEICGCAVDLLGLMWFM